jgi:hypothetical protein
MQFFLLGFLIASSIAQEEQAAPPMVTRVYHTPPGWFLYAEKQANNPLDRSRFGPDAGMVYFPLDSRLIIKDSENRQKEIDAFITRMWQQFKRDKAPFRPPPPPPNEIAIRVRADGGVQIGKQKLTITSLPADLRRRKVNKPNLSVRIDEDKGASSEHIHAIFDICQSVGITEIGVPYDE